MYPIHRIAATAVASTALVLSAGATAHAQSVTIKDKASDVVAYTSEDTDENGSQLGYQDSLTSGADIRSMRVKHTKKSLSINLSFAELDRNPDLTVAIKVPGKSRPQWFITSKSRTQAEVYNVDEKRVCTIPLNVKAGAKGTMRAVVKRSCIGKPQKVKIAAVAAAVEMTDTTYSVKQDVVSSTSIRAISFTKWLKSS